MELVASTPTQARSADGKYISWKEHIIDDELMTLAEGAEAAAEDAAIDDVNGDGFRIS